MSIEAVDRETFDPIYQLIREKEKEFTLKGKSELLQSLKNGIEEIKGKKSNTENIQLIFVPRVILEMVYLEQTVKVFETNDQIKYYPSTNPHRKYAPSSSEIKENLIWFACYDRPEIKNKDIVRGTSDSDITAEENSAREMLLAFELNKSCINSFRKANVLAQATTKSNYQLTIDNHLAVLNQTISYFESLINKEDGGSGDSLLGHFACKKESDATLRITDDRKKIIEL